MVRRAIGVAWLGATSQTVQVHYSTTVHLDGRNTGIPVPPDVLDGLGGGRRPPVVIRVAGYEYRSTVGQRNGLFLVPLSAERRAAAGVAGGEAVEVELELDLAERTVEVPDDLAGALAAAGVRSDFDALALSHRRAHVDSVTSARTPETRTRRMQAVVDRLTDA